MTSESTPAYPAEYYFPEFLNNRSDDPRKSPPVRQALSTSVDNGIGTTAAMPVLIRETSEVKQTKRSNIKKAPATKSLAFDIATDQGLPGADMTNALRTDPKTNLIRDPADKNIPRLLVDDDALKKSLRTPRLDLTNVPKKTEQKSDPKILPSKPVDQIDSTNKPKPNLNDFQNGNPYGRNRVTPNPSFTQRSLARFATEEPPVDDFWKKELKINDEGFVSIEPLKYDKELYEGPYGLTRQGSYVYYISLGILTILAAIFLILTGVFYAQKFPDSSSDAVKIAGMSICALVFYVGILLILIGIWHQKYRLENPKRRLVPPDLIDESTTHLKSSMETQPSYDYNHQQPIDYGYNGNYMPPPYNANVNGQMLLQQPGAATGIEYQDPVVWPSNVEINPQYDSRFNQPFEMTYGLTGKNAKQNESGWSSELGVGTDLTKPEKKKAKPDTTKPVQAKPTLESFDNIFPNSTVTDVQVPRLKKAPETEELMKTIADLERNNIKLGGRAASNGRLSNRIQPMDEEGNTTLTKENQDRRRSRRRRHHHRSHRRSSYSSCSTCSDGYYDDVKSDVSINRFEKEQAKLKSYKGRPTRAHSFDPKVAKAKGSRVERNLLNIDEDLLRQSGVTIGLEDVPNVRDDRFEQIPIVHRTIIVEPVPAPPTSTVVVKPKTKATAGVHISGQDSSNKSNPKGAADRNIKKK